MHSPKYRRLQTTLAPFEKCQGLFYVAAGTQDQLADSYAVTHGDFDLAKTCFISEL